MSNSFSLITLELGISVMATIISIIGIILYAYIYFQLHEESQAIILVLGCLCFMFSGLESLNMIISLSNPNSIFALHLFKFEQIILSLTILPWLKFIMGKLKLSESFHSKLANLYTISMFVFILISAVALLYPTLFIPTKNHIDSLSSINSIKSRGELGIIYKLRDFIFTAYFVIIVWSFIYEMVMNQKYNIPDLILISMIALAFFDDFNALPIYDNGINDNFLFFPTIPFSRITLVYAIFNIIYIYLSTSRFITAIHRKNNQTYDLESIKAQDAIIINTAINTSEKLSEIKDNFQQSVNSLLEKAEYTYSNINNLKNDINKVIEHTNEFITIENFQINDGNTNLEKINELVETYPNLQMSVELQKKTLTESNDKLQKSIEKVYALQADSRKIIANFEDFKNKLLEEKNNFSNELIKSESFNQLSFQINRIISFMTNISDKTKTLAVNSSIQAFKSGEWVNNFSVVSKEVSELVVETSASTNRMKKLLFEIEEIFKKFSSASININNNMNSLLDEASITHNNLIKFNSGMEKQNDYNMNIIKNTEKIYSSISNMTNLIVNEENDFTNIKGKVGEINIYIEGILEKASKQNYEIKNLMRDMNKLLATSSDLESVTNSLNDEINKFLEYTNDLEDRINEYSKVI